MIYMALLIFIIFYFPITDLKIFSSFNVIQQIKKSALGVYLVFKDWQEQFSGDYLELSYSSCRS